MLGINENTMNVIYVAAAIYLIYRIFFRKSPMQDDYERLYNKILTSDKHKVKGQYDNDEDR